MPPAPSASRVAFLRRIRVARRREIAAAASLRAAAGWLGLAVLVALAAPACRAPAPAGSGGELLVHAAASLTDALAEVAAAHERATGERVLVSAGASNQVARQVAAGAPGDILFTADEASMDVAQLAGAIDPATRRVLLSNRLVVVVRSDALPVIARLADLAHPQIRSVAMADPLAVPAGLYARERLERAGLWPAVAPKVLPVENVRAVVAAVASGSADAGLAYVTDIVASPAVRAACDVPEGGARPITYPVAVLAASERPERARAFLGFLASAGARRVFERHGFLVEPDIDAGAQP